MASLTDFRPLKQPIWQFLYRPILMASLALHGLVLMIPLPSTPESVEAIAETEEEQEEVIDLAALAAAQTQPSPLPTTTPQPIAPASPLPPVPTPAAIAAPLVPQPVPAPAPTPQTAPSPTPQASPTPQVSPTPTPQAAVPTPTPAPTLGLSPDQIQALQAALRQQAESGAQTQTERAALAVPVTCPSLGDYQSDFCEGEQWKPGIFYQQTRSNETPEQALEAFQRIFADSSFTEISPYADLPLYELKSKTDPNYPSFYLSLVQPSRIGRTTIGIVWAIDPNQPPGQPRQAQTPQ